MAITRYGFIVLAPGYQPDAHQSQMMSSQFTTFVVGVSDLEEANIAAKELLRKNVQVIELCGGFGDKKAAQLRAQLATEVPIGHVIFNQAEDEKLQKLLNKPAAQ